MSDGISESVQRFVAAHITAIEELEVLLLLHRTPERAWTAAQVAREVGSSVMSIHDRLGRLSVKGFLSVNEADNDLTYCYNPGNEETNRTIEELAKTYKERRLRVINLIYASPPPSDIETFADAFRLRKDGKD